MSFSVSFALASFGIAFGRSLSSSVFKQTSMKTSFSPASGLAAAISLNFAAVDALNDFGIDDNQSMELLGSYFLQVFNLSESSWKLHMLDRLLTFESPAVPLDKPLSSASFSLAPPFSWIQTFSLCCRSLIQFLFLLSLVRLTLPTSLLLSIQGSSCCGLCEYMPLTHL